MKLWSLLAITVLAVSARAGVRVVDPSGPTGTYGDLQAAVDASADEDVILVKTGSYSTCRVVDRSLTIVADSGASVSIAGSVLVEGLAATRFVHVVGIETRGVYGATPDAAHGASVVDCVGSVRFQDCTLRAALGTQGQCTAHVGALVVRSMDVSFTRCVLEGVSAQPTPPPFVWETGPGGSGLTSFGSRVSLHGCTIRGGRSGFEYSCGPYGYGDGMPGPAGVSIDGGKVWIAGTGITGGPGGNAGPGAAKTCGSGGTGLRAVGTAQVHAVDSTFVSGPGGYVTYGICSTPPPTQVQAPATLQFLAGSAPRFEHASVVRVGQSTPVHFETGMAGASVAAFWSPRDGWSEAPWLEGVLLTRVPSRQLGFGIADALGRLDGVLIGPALPVGTTARVFRTQGYQRSPFGDERVGPPELFVVLDPAY